MISSSRSTAEGVGLGLSLVAAVAKLHGGSLRLDDNQPDQTPRGLRAVLALPAPATLTITVGSQPAEQSAALDEAGKEERVGLALAPVTPELRARLGLDDGKGAVVTEVAPDSKAEDSGVRPGDVILGVAGHAVANPAEAAQEIQAARKQHKEAVTLLVRRDGTTYYLALQLA